MHVNFMTLPLPSTIENPCPQFNRRSMPGCREEDFQIKNAVSLYDSCGLASAQEPSTLGGHEIFYNFFYNFGRPASLVIIGNVKTGRESSSANLFSSAVGRGWRWCSRLEVRGKRKFGCSNPSRDRPKSLKQVVTAPLPNAWHQV